MFAIALVLPALLGTGPTPGQSPDPVAAEPTPTLWLHAKRVIVRPGEVLEDAAVLVEEGRIVAVGAGVEAPEGARVIEGEVICAGLFDPWSSLGVDTASVTDLAIGASAATRDALDTYLAPEIQSQVLRAGVTTARVQAGMQAFVGGIGAVIRTGIRGFDEVFVAEESCVNATVAITRGKGPPDVFARIGEVDKLVSILKAGAARAKSKLDYEDKLKDWREEIAESEAELEKDFKKAKKDRDKDIEKAKEKGKEHKEKRYKEDKPPKPPKEDSDADVMARVAMGELPFVVEIHRAPELRELLAATDIEELSRLRLVIAGGAEVLPYADQLAKRNIPVIVWPTPSGADEFEEYRATLAGELDGAGVEVLLGSRGAASSRDLPLLAAMAIGHGMDPVEAFDAVTLAPARTFDLAHRLGSVERGKDADLLVLSGDPLATTTKVQFVISNGDVVVVP